MEEEIKKILKQERYLHLNYFGFGIWPDDRFLHRSMREKNFMDSRIELENAIEEIHTCYEFMKKVKKRKTINYYFYSSYALKHFVEWWTERETGKRQYVSNGSLIVGALLAGFKVQEDALNAVFNISSKCPFLAVEGRLSP